MINAAETIIIDGQRVPLEGETNLLAVIRKAGIDIPTFCYHSELSVYGACRMCVVEVDGMGVVTSCSTPPKAGMVVHTSTDNLRTIRRTIIELLLANHDRDCTTCEKNGRCKLQDLAQRFGIKKVRFGHRDERLPLDTSSPSIVRDPNKCILCGDCVRMCKEVQGIGVLDFSYRGAKAQVTPAFGKRLAEVDCVNCGQCAAVCPTGALVVKSDTEKAWKALHDPTKVVVAQVAPAVRVAFSEEFGGRPGEVSTGKLVAALKKIGFDKVFDTSFAADLTVFEETSEFLTRLEKGEKERLPQFTSCCPGWVKYAEQYHPDLLDNLSTCRSPQQMFGSVAKRYFAKELGIDPTNMVVVSIMPCTAKKFEARREEFSRNGIRDVDIVLTTQEVARMVREAGVDFESLEAEQFDMPLGLATGAGVIFGVTGGVAEAVLRAASELVTSRPLEDVNFAEVRGLEGIKEAEVKLGDASIRIAVVHSLGKAGELISRIKSGEVHYDLVEVMACPGGCIGGGGQPVPQDAGVRRARAKGLYVADRLNLIRKSLDNPHVKALYERWLETPNSHAAHEALHTAYGTRRRIVAEDISLSVCSDSEGKLDVAVCVGTCCYLKGSYDILMGLASKVQAAGLGGKVNLRATFCFENCEHAPNVKVDGVLKSGEVAANVERIFTEEILPRICGSRASSE